MSQKTILYVEDNEFNRKIIRQLLAQTSYRLREAHDGESGVRAAQDELPDLILMDVQLPKMSGLEATQRLRADPRTAAVHDEVFEQADRVRALRLDGEGDARRREHRVQVDPRDLGRVLVERDIAHVVLGERRVLAPRAHAHAHVEPFAALHRVGRGKLGRVLRVVGRVHFLELGRELLLLAGRGRKRRCCHRRERRRTANPPAN